MPWSRAAAREDGAISCSQPGLTYGHEKVFKMQAGEANNSHFNTMSPSAASHHQLVCINVNFHMLCEAKSKQLTLCSICTMTFYWKELETPSRQKYAKDSQLRSPLRHREQLYSLKLQFWENG